MPKKKTSRCKRQFPANFEVKLRRMKRPWPLVFFKKKNIFFSANPKKCFGVLWDSWNISSNWTRFRKQAATDGTKLDLNIGDSGPGFGGLIQGQIYNPVEVFQLIDIVNYTTLFSWNFKFYSKTFFLMMNDVMIIVMMSDVVLERVVSNISYFHPGSLGKWSNWTSIFFKRVETT